MGGLSYNKVGEGLETAWTSNNFTHIFNGEICCKMTKWKVASIANTHAQRNIEKFVIGASLSEPHTCDVNEPPRLYICMYIYIYIYICGDTTDRPRKHDTDDCLVLLYATDSAFH